MGVLEKMIICLFELGLVEPDQPPYAIWYFYNDIIRKKNLSTRLKYFSSATIKKFLNDPTGEGDVYINQMGYADIDNDIVYLVESDDGIGSTIDALYHEFRHITDGPHPWYDEL
jgi:hypothetical protein